jgi:NADH-quinone oxidoreductase subunit N
LAVVGVLNSVISAYYYLRVVKIMYLGSGESENRITYSLPVLVAVAVAVIGILVIGMVPGPLFEFTEEAVRSLLIAI